MNPEPEILEMMCDRCNCCEIEIVNDGEGNYVICLGNCNEFGHHIDYR